MSYLIGWSRLVQCVLMKVMMESVGVGVIVYDNELMIMEGGGGFFEARLRANCDLPATQGKELKSEIAREKQKN